MINATVLELYKVTACLLERYNLEARWGWKWRWSGSSLRRKRVRHCQQMPPHHVTSVMHLCLSIYSLSDQLCLRSHPWEGGMNLLTLSLNLWDLMKGGRNHTQLVMILHEGRYSPAAASTPSILIRSSQCAAGEEYYFSLSLRQNHAS